MKMNRLFTILVVLTLLLSCSTPMIRVSDELKTNTMLMDVDGVQGWQINQIIRYGDFTTSKVKRSWSTKYELEFFTRFEGAKNKLGFTQYMPGTSAEVSAIGRINSTEIDLLNGYLSYPLRYKNYFTGLIIPQGSNNNWEFIIHNPDGLNIDNMFDTDLRCGYAKDNNGNEITVNAIREFEGNIHKTKFDNPGYEFNYDGHTVAAVETINNGRIWIKNDLPQEIKLVVASMSTSLLLRHSLEEVMENL